MTTDKARELARQFVESDLWRENSGPFEKEIDSIAQLIADTERRCRAEAQALMAAAYRVAANEIATSSVAELNSWLDSPKAVAAAIMLKTPAEARVALDALVADKVKEAVSLERKNWLEEGWGKSVTQQIEEAVEKEREACAAVIDTEIKISLRALAAAIRGRG